MIENPHDEEREQLSALLDGELQENRQHALIDRLSENPALRSQLARYGRISAVLHQDEPPRVDATGVVDAVHAALQHEPTVLTPKRQHAPNVPRIALGAALAAGVALLSILVAPQLLEPGKDLSTPETFAFSPHLSVPDVDIARVALGSNQALDANTGVETAPQRWKVLQPALRDKLDSYLLEHNEFAARLGVSHPSVHVGFVSNQDAQP